MGGLSFLSPLFLLGALAVAIPVVLHLFRRRNDPGGAVQRDALPASGADRAGAPAPAAGPAAARAARGGAAAAGDRLRAAVPAVADVGVGGRRHRGGRGRLGEHGRRRPLRAREDAGATGHRPTRRPATRWPSCSLPAGPTSWSSRARIAPRRARRSRDCNPRSGRRAITPPSRAALDVVGTRTGRLVLVTDLQSSGWTSADAVGVPARVSIEVADVGPLPPNVGVAALDRTPQGVRVGLTSTGAVARAWRSSCRSTTSSLGRQRVTLPADGTGEADLSRRDGDRWRRARPPGDARRHSGRRRAMAGARSAPRRARGDHHVAGCRTRRRRLRAPRARSRRRAVPRGASRCGRPTACGTVSDLSGVAVAVLVGTAGLDRRGAEALRPVRGQRRRAAGGGGTRRQRGVCWPRVLARRFRDCAWGRLPRRRSASSPPTAGIRSSACSIPTPARSTRRGSHAHRDDRDDGAGDGDRAVRQRRARAGRPGAWARAASACLPRTCRIAGTTWCCSRPSCRGSSRRRRGWRPTMPRPPGWWPVTARATRPAVPA